MHFTIILPNPTEDAYTNNIDGRIALETRENDVIEKINHLKSGETYKSDDANIRGSAGGMVYVYDGRVIVKEKLYKKANDRYLSCFSGLSGDLDDLKNPERIIVREGLEELCIVSQNNSSRYIPNLCGPRAYDGLFLEEEMINIVDNAVSKTNYAWTSKLETSFVPVNLIKGKDVLTVKNHEGEIMSETEGILDFNAKFNCFDILGIANIYHFPSNVRLIDADFGDRITMLSPEQINKIWNNWGKSFEAEVYSGNKFSKELFPGLYDTLLQKVFMSLGFIEGEIRYDYKNRGADSIF
jgi:hypothetical protein